MKRKKFRVLIVDDHLMWRKTLRLFFSTQTNVEVIEMLTDKGRAVADYRQIHPNLIILDVNQLDVAAPELLKSDPDIRIIGVTADMSLCLPQTVGGTGIRTAIPKDMLLDYLLPRRFYCSYGW